MLGDFTLHQNKVGMVGLAHGLFCIGHDLGQCNVSDDMFIVQTFENYGIYADTSACYWIQDRVNWRNSSWYIIIYQDSVGG